MTQTHIDNQIISSNNSFSLVYVGYRKAHEAFTEIKCWLERMDMLPDHYFLLDPKWEGNKEIPEHASFSCMVKHESTEGIYLIFNLLWKENNSANMSCFAKGKTLNDNDFYLERMCLAASIINMTLCSQESFKESVCNIRNSSESTVVHLNNKERQLLINSLLLMRSTQPKNTRLAEQILRRVLGSIIEFVNTVGTRPLLISDYDMAILAIQDGNLPVFNEVYKRIHNKTDELLVYAASRPGKIGQKMTYMLLNKEGGFSYDVYLSACKNAIAAGDSEKVLMLADKAAECIIGLDMSIYNNLINEAIKEDKLYIARGLRDQHISKQVST